MQVPWTNSSCFNLKQALRNNSMYLSSRFMFCVVYSLAFNRGGIGLELESKTVVILDSKFIN